MANGTLTPLHRAWTQVDPVSPISLEFVRLDSTLGSLLIFTIYLLIERVYGTQFTRA